MFQVNPLLGKNQALFFSTDKSKNLKCRRLQFLFGSLRASISFQKQFLSHFGKIVYYYFCLKIS